MSSNALYFGDNLDVLRDCFADESVDLVYLDPPFNSKANYNVLFSEQDGSRSAAQIHAFTDTWKWDEAAVKSYRETVEDGGLVAEALRAFAVMIPQSNMLAYVVMMAPRLKQLRRVLKPTGSIYLHCDPTAVHYLRLLMDAVFGPRNYRNQITWKRSHAHSDAKQGRKAFGNVSDILLYYTAGDKRTFNTQYTPYTQEYIDKYFRYQDPDGRRYWLDNLTGPGGAAKGNPYYKVMGVSRYWRYSRKRMDELIAQGRIVQTKPGNVPQYKRYLDEGKGLPLQNIWTDIPPINMMAAERLGYPTQKPVALLERIIRTSSNEGDVVLDPFCGCGTAIAAAQRLSRRWAGIDITFLAIDLIKRRLRDELEIKVKKDYDLHGEPVNTAEARALAEYDRFQFQWWVLSMVNARGVDKKKGADQGIDGRIYFHDARGGEDTKVVILSVKSGKVGVSDVRELNDVVRREDAAMGVLVTLEEPTQAMRVEAAEAGTYKSPWRTNPFAKTQILTVEEIFGGKEIDMPPHAETNVTFKKAPKAKPKKAKTPEMYGD